MEKQKRVQNPGEHPDIFYKLDDEFHNILLGAVGRPKLAQLYEDAFVHVRRWRNFEVRSLERIKDLPKEHEAIIAAIKDGDSEAARNVLNYHIDSVGRYGREIKKKFPEYFI